MTTLIVVACIFAGIAVGGGELIRRAILGRQLEHAHDDLRPQFPSAASTEHGPRPDVPLTVVAPPVSASPEALRTRDASPSSAGSRPEEGQLPRAS
jgi:hypothetical protein